MNLNDEAKPSLSWAKVVAILGKFTSALAKVAKSLKFILAAGTFGAYAFLFTWKFALLLMFGIGVHELGHVWAMRYSGMKTKGFYFIPFVGGAAVADEAFPSGRVEGFVALMGPTFGVLTVLPALIMYGITHQPIWAAAAVWLCTVNLFNLFPINPLDGGRWVKSIAFSLSQTLGIIVLGIGFVLAIVLSYMYGLTLLTFIAIIGMMEVRPFIPIVFFPILFPIYIIACIISFFSLLRKGDDPWPVFKGGFVSLFSWDRSQPIMTGVKQNNPTHWVLSAKERAVLVGWYIGLVFIFILIIMRMAHIPGAEVGEQFLKS